jgi:aminopeptidase N
MLALAVLALAAGACGEDDGIGSEVAEARSYEPKTNWKRDLLSTDLAIDLESHTATAVIDVAASTRQGTSLEVPGLHIESVAGERGPLSYRVEDGRLDIGMRARRPDTLTIQYSFDLHTKLEGALETGTTFLWPHFCGNLFPCKSAPDEGTRFALSLTGVADDALAVFPKRIDADAPAYMLAWAIGDYTQIELGTTSAGRNVSVYYLPGEKTAATAGTRNLVEVFDWLERSYGGYIFGNDVASVSADWGPGAFGGMEHHPLWHVSHDSMGDEETHAHEAAHGWFGDGVRIACWEDLTLSEGTVSYLTARAMEAVSGSTVGSRVWADYEERLADVIASEDRLAWPEGCNQIDVLNDLWNEVPYMKGAFFYRAVEDQIGRAALDAAIARFYADNKGGAAGMQDMLDTIERETGYDASELADDWLRSMGRPD